ncbi:hypothetical protein ACOMHN_066951 [Nucella lapillus]
MNRVTSHDSQFLCDSSASSRQGIIRAVTTHPAYRLFRHTQYSSTKMTGSLATDPGDFVLWKSADTVMTADSSLSA